MEKIFCILLSACIFLSLNLTGVQAEEPEAARIVEGIKVKGAKAVLAKLTSDNNWTEFEKVCDEIETGEQEWLEVATLLYPGSDAATTLSLEYSVARALPKAPRRVLALLAETEHDPRGVFMVDKVCTSPHIEPNPGVSERYLTETERVLESTDTNDSPRLNGLRLKCLENIRKIINYSKKHGLWKAE